VPVADAKVMERKKFEQVIELDLNPAPLWVIDFNVMTHDILFWYENKIEGSFSKEVEAKLVKGVWALYVNRGPQFLPRHAYRTVLVADYRDPKTSNYWRDDFMRESEQVQTAWTEYAEEQGVAVDSLRTNYKGTRGTKTEAFFFVYNIGKEYCQQYFPWYWILGYEADDLAGSIARLSRSSEEQKIIRKRQILLHTCDRDWCQLVDNENKIYFSNSRLCRPREKIQEQLQKEEGVLEWVEHKMGVKIEHPSELASHKAEQGDMGDNAVKGSPIELFDLIHPHSKWNVDELLWTEDFLECMNNPEANTRNDHFEQTLRQFSKIYLDVPIKV
jgi:hypothetical protein